MEHSVTITNFTDLTLDHSIRAVLLDLDNTCYAYEPCHQFALESIKTVLEERVGTVPDFEERYAAAQKEVKSRIPTHGASHSRILYFQNLLETLKNKDAIEFSLQLERTYWDSFLTVMEPTAGLREFLAQCRKNGTTVAVVSDLTTSIQCEKLLKLGVAHLIDYLVTSEEAGAEKPDSAAFLLALKKVDADALHTLYIGDSYEKDILGAQALGISAIQFVHDPFANQKTTRQSRSL